jgi:hypothetical protein
MLPIPPQKFIYNENYYMTFRPGDTITNTVVNCLYTTYWNGFEILYDKKSLPLGQYVIQSIYYGLYDNVEFFELVGIPEPPIIPPGERFLENNWPINNPVNGFFAGRFVKFPQ